MPKARPWYYDFFKDFQPWFGKIPKKTTNTQVRFLIDKLKLKPGSSFLDCPCGVGRVSIPLAKKGIRVFGVDLCEPYLDELAVKAKRAGLDLPTQHRDMRRIDFQNRFDAAGNLWTSFGFFESERDNLLVLKKAYQALKPGGRFCLHVVNRDFIMAHYTDRDWQDLDGILCTEKRKFEFATSINRGVWTFYKDGKPTSHHVDLRMYSYHELIAMFRQVGFVDIEGFGTTEGGPITQHTLMQWIFGTKPK